MTRLRLFDNSELGTEFVTFLLLLAFHVWRRMRLKASAPVGFLLMADPPKAMFRFDAKCFVAALFPSGITACTIVACFRSLSTLRAFIACFNLSSAAFFSISSSCFNLRYTFHQLLGFFGSMIFSSQRRMSRFIRFCQSSPQRPASCGLFSSILLS